MDKKTMRQYLEEERSLINNRVKLVHYRLFDLLEVMKRDEISPRQKIEQLASDLSDFHKSSAFKLCKTMGEIVEEQLKHNLPASLKL